MNSMECLFDDDELHKASKVFYESLLDPASRTNARNLFNNLDKDKNGRVTKKELSQSLRNSPALPHLDYLFGLLDSDMSGELDFKECITLYYIIKARPECNGCGKPLVELFYTCVSCWDCDSGAYNLCSSCYTSKKYSHSHKEFVDNYLAFNRLQSILVKTKKIQCSVCGDIHNVNVPPFLDGGQHIVKRDDGCGYVCEWCVRRTCSSCGSIFSSLQSDATPRQWFMDNFYCKGCGEPGNNTDKCSLIENFKKRCSDGSIPQCENCCFKIQNDQLFHAPRIQKQLSKTKSNKVAAAPVADLGNFRDILNVAQLAISAVQANKNHEAVQCKMM